MEVVGVFTVHLHAQFHMPCSIVSLATAIKLKAKY